MGVFAGPDVSESGLVLALDAGNPKSYISTLIINGTFDSNVTGWTTTNSTNTWSSGKMQISRTGGDGRVSYQTFSTIVGQSYRVTSEVNSSGSRGDVYIYDGSGIGGTRFLSILGTNGQTLTLTGTFTAISTITTLGFGVDANGTSIVVDNVSVSPILWTDLSGRGNTGTLTNGPTYSSSNGGSLVFDGTDDYVNCGTFFNYSNFTISLWVYPGSTQTTYADIFDNNHTGTQNFVCQQNATTTNQYAFVCLNATNASSTSNFTLTANTWHHLTFTWNNSVASAYINGVFHSSGAAANAINYSNPILSIGRWSATGRHWNGRISNFVAYDRVISLAEIQQNFNATRGRYGI